jgi:hypothetical protein
VFFANPFVQRAALNSQLPCRFGNGVVSHNKNTQHVYFVNQKIAPEWAYFAPVQAYPKNITGIYRTDTHSLYFLFILPFTCEKV